MSGYVGESRICLIRDATAVSRFHFNNSDELETTTNEDAEEEERRIVQRL